MRAKIAIFFALVVLIAALTARESEAQHPNIARGLGSGASQESSGLDHINTYNGSLTVTIPIGQKFQVGGAFQYGLTLVYTGKIWKFETRDVSATPDCPASCRNEYGQCNASCTVTAAFIDTESNAGAGWQVSFGKLLTPTAPENETDDWAYLDGTGSLHRLYQVLHAGHPSPGGPYRYTRDNTYRRFDTSSFRLENPDGSRQSFGETGETVKLSGAAESGEERPAFVQVESAGVTYLTDSYSRRTEVESTWGPQGQPLISRVVLPAFGGTTASYLFEYTLAWLARPCNDTDPLTDNHEPAAFLTAVVLPDGTRYSMPILEAYSLGYDPAVYDPTVRQPVGSRQCASNSCSPDPVTGGGCETAFPGVLKKVNLPTLGSIDWTYRSWMFPSGDPGRYR